MLIGWNQPECLLMEKILLFLKEKTRLTARANRARQPASYLEEVIGAEGVERAGAESGQQEAAKRAVAAARAMYLTVFIV